MEKTSKLRDVFKNFGFDETQSNLQTHQLKYSVKRHIPA